MRTTQPQGHARAMCGTSVAGGAHGLHARPRAPFWGSFDRVSCSNLFWQNPPTILANPADSCWFTSRKFRGFANTKLCFANPPAQMTRAQDSCKPSHFDRFSVGETVQQPLVVPRQCFSYLWVTSAPRPLPPRLPNLRSTRSDNRDSTQRGAGGLAGNVVGRSRRG